MLKHSIYLFFCLIMLSCGNKINSPVESVNTFISAVRDHDMTKAWNILAPEAQAFYNGIGEKNRKSGKGILEHDVSEITKFKSEGKDFSITASSTDEVKITSTDEEVTILITNVNGEYKIKDGASVKNIIKAISAEAVKKEYYF